jgi:membrane protease YdiL (CAAX protease family)
LLGVGVATPIAVALSAGRLLGQSRKLYGEQRIVTATPARAAYALFVRIPLGTALPEEVIFRGALLGLFARRHSRLKATAMTSALFGLWHIAPTLDRLETNAALRGKTRLQKAGWVALTVGVTTVTGFALSFLRFRSRSVVAPWFAHSAANGTGYLAGWLAARLSGNAEGEEDAPPPQYR